MRANLNHAIFSAIITFIVSFPLLGLNLVTGGTSMSIEGADTTTFTYIAAAVAIVFFFQLFHDKIMGVFSHIPTPEVGHLYSDLPQSKKNSVEKWFTIALVALAIIWPFFVSRGSIDLATLVLIYVMLGLGLNIVVGLAGLLDLGYVAFYAVGAYSYALLSEYFGLSFWVALPIGGLMAALFGFLLGFPVLRLRGDYLAIVTLGFGEIIRIVLLNSTSVTGGPNGIG
ncbi:DUF3382 domain-containing protein, partial [Oleiphilus sp. HI0079]|uniref:ABC transporter permease subunit n=2 Tax=unclassified Oleiphilus TaxID=2631174 RepID=UPI001E35C887